MMIRKAGDVVQLLTRNGHDWSDRMPKVRDALKALPIDVWLDGEAVVLDRSGRPDFNALQNAFDRRSTAKITLFLFDVLWVDEADIRERPLHERRDLLHQLLETLGSPLIRFSEAFMHDPRSLLASARELKLEGIVGKRIDAPYRSGRSNDWIKLKCLQRQEFVVGGITRELGTKVGVVSLLLGLYEGEDLQYVGSVRPYLMARAEKAFDGRAAVLAQATAPFSNPPPKPKDRDVVWLKPEIVAEVSFLERTVGGELRGTSFIAFRSDKPADAVTAEPVTYAQDVERSAKPAPRRRRSS
jgi:bifunctional non-homologous end joining protein LigD